MELFNLPFEAEGGDFLNNAIGSETQEEIDSVTLQPIGLQQSHAYRLLAALKMKLSVLLL